MIPLSPVPFLVAGLALGLAGCSETTVFKSAAVAAGVAAEPGPAPDFIERSRPQRLDYMPIGTAAAPRAIPGKTQAEVKAAEGQMDAVRAANESRGAEAKAAGATPPN